MTLTMIDAYNQIHDMFDTGKGWRKPPVANKPKQGKKRPAGKGKKAKKFGKKKKR